MGNNFMWTFIMYMAMNNNKNPIPFSTVLSSLDIVPAPMRFAVQANAIQGVEASCLADDDNLRQSVRQLVADHSIDVSKYPAVASFVGPRTNGASTTGATPALPAATKPSHKSQ